MKCPDCSDRMDGCRSRPTVTNTWHVLCIIMGVAAWLLFLLALQSCLRVPCCKGLGSGLVHAQAKVDTAERMQELAKLEQRRQYERAASTCAELLQGLTDPARRKQMIRRKQVSELNAALKRSYGELREFIKFSVEAFDWFRFGRGRQRNNTA